jgi:GNAT superfamily N-acetyltransferase
MWMECFAEDARIEADDAEAIEERFLAHARESHDWTYPEEALRNYARNFAEATERLTGSTERLPEIGDVVVHRVAEDRIDDWLHFFDHDAFAGNPSWASCYCLEPHVPASDGEPERAWRDIRAAMVERLRTGATFGYLAYVDGKPAGWVNASARSDYGLYATVDPDGPEPATVVGVSCFIIAPQYRRHGIAAALLDRVVADASGRAAAWIEGYPRNSEVDDDAGHFRGPRSMYHTRGFSPAEVRERYTVMRRPAPD